MNAIAYTVVNIPQKRLVKSETLLFVGCAVLYLILTGSIVSNSVQREQLKSDLSLELRRAQETESVFVAEGGELPLFIGQGYEEPHALEVIKRRRNVAENSRTSLY